MTAVPVLRNYIAGTFTDSADLLDVTNPATGALLARAPRSTQGDVDRAIAAAHGARQAWARRPAIERAQYLRRVASRIRDNATRIARTLTEEQGKISSLAAVEVAFTADYMDYMAEWARRIEGEIITSDRPDEQILLLRKPMGVVVGILPWNFPFFLIARKMAPALVTGNTLVIKPSEETPINCHLFTELLAQCELPPGAFNVVYGQGTTGAAMASHAGVDMISFTGSVATGERIAAAAAPYITKLNLELGGKAPAIVLADADLALAVHAVRSSRVINTGQVCNCVERVYVERPVADEFIARLAEAMVATRYGDPLGGDDEVEMGPLINRKGLDNVAASVRRAVDDGATVVTGGRIADLGQGFHYQPTVLTNCHNGMDIMRREIFGPVVPIQVVDDLDEAITLANDCDYGLTSSVYTRDLGKAMQAMRELDFGETYINRENFEAMQGFHAGVRKSGLGGADGKHGLYEYTHTQVVYLQG